MDFFNPERMKLAREQRGLSQKALADELGVVQSEISKVEGGKRGPSDEFIGKAAAFFGYAPSFFAQPETPIPSGLAFHRKRSALPASVRDRIEAEARARMLDLSALIREHGDLSSEIPPRNGRTPSDMAKALRTAWDVPPGPVENLVQLLEKRHVFVMEFDFGTDLLDAFFLPPAEARGVLCLVSNANPAFPPDRRRFTLAHELGHAVLHRDEIPTERDMKRFEKEANEFAGEFLAPKDDVLPDLSKPLSFALLRDLKAKWGMSMASLVYRAVDIEAIRPAEAKRTWFFFTKYGYRKSEPGLGLQRETPRAIAWLANDLVRKRGLDHAASLLHLAPKCFEQRYPEASMIASATSQETTAMA